MTDPRDRVEAPVYEPFDIVLEQNLLGSMLLDNRLIDEVAADLEPEQLYDPLHGRLFQLICHLSTEGEVSPHIVHAVMKTDPGLSAVGGARYLLGLMHSAPARPPLKEYVRILKDLAMRRSLIEIGDRLSQAAQEPPSEATAQQVADEATEALLAASQGISKPIMTPYEVAMRSVAAVERIMSGEAVPLLRTGLDFLDAEIGGFGGSELVTILGKSGMGKSAMMGQLAINMALQRIPTLVFSLEMTAKQWIDRTVTSLDYDTAPRAMWYKNVRNGRLTSPELERFMLSSRKLDGLPLEIIEEGGLSMAQISARARAFRAKHGPNPDGSHRIGAVFIDYFQIVEPRDYRASREQQVAGIARDAKALAKRLDWAVIGGSQMNEDDKNRTKEERRPRASDARESKGIMNESDIMLAPYREAVAVLNRRPLGSHKGDPAYDTWYGELTAVANRLDLLGLKVRNGAQFDIELFCEMGASAIRDEKPHRVRSETELAQADLLQFPR